MRNNVKLLSCRELCALNDKYCITVDDDTDNILVVLRNYNRVTKHSKDKPFSISSKIRKITFSMDAIDFWLRHLHDCKFSLFDIQQVINYASISYLKLSDKTIFELLANIEKTCSKGE